HAVPARPARARPAPRGTDGALHHHVRGVRAGDPLPARAHPRPGRLRPRAGHSRDHGQPLGPWLRLPVQLALRPVLARRRRAAVRRRPAALGPHRRRERGRRGLRVHRRRDRPGLARGGRGPGLSRPAFARVLGRADLLLFSVSAILTIDTLASAASMGVSWFTWWGITMALFFIPYGLMTAELGAAWPDEGGLYVWVREAMGPRWGSLAAWFYWINNAYWTASVYMVFAATFHSIFLRDSVPRSLRDGPGATWLQAGIAALLTVLTVAVGVVRLGVSKWLPNLGGVVKAAIFIGLGGLGLASLLGARPPANDFSPA